MRLARYLVLSALLLVTLAAAARAAAPLSPPSAVVTLQPDPAYADSTLRGSAAFSDPDGDLEGASTYRWHLNATAVYSGTVPQSLLLPLDGTLLGTDGQPPAQSQGLAFVAGRFGHALRFQPSANSRLAYPAAGNAGPDEGSLDAWLQLAHDLADPAYDTYPRLFSYVVDDEHQLYVEVNDDRLIITSRNNGAYYGTWPAPPGWRAGEWHHFAATWSASAGRLAVYYDCAPAAEGDEYPAIAGTAANFTLGSGATWGVLDAALDDVRLSRRALSAAEIAAACVRPGAAPNDEVVWPGQAAVGDTVTFELTPCDATGACGAPGTDSVTITPAPLGPLSPATGVLPAGTLTVTLALTTTAAADCRWSPLPDTPYVIMPNAFAQGQGTLGHTTVITGLADLAERRFYVRCDDRATPRDPDDFERRSHARVLGPWTGNYPRLANLWGGYDPTYGVEFFAGYDLWVAGGWNGAANQAAAIRAANANTKVLLSQNATYGDGAWDPLTAQWLAAAPGEPGYACLLRDSGGSVLFVDYWGHPMYNMTQTYCRGVIAGQSIANFLAPGNDLLYDGIYWDRLHDTISWLGADIDADLDGQPDDPDALDAAYRDGMYDFFTRMRAALPYAVLMGNDGPQIYAPWINGRCYEWQLPAILDGSEWLNWDDVAASYRDWSTRGHVPHTTFIESAPEALYSEKYTFAHTGDMPPAMVAEAAASYPRMRYGLTTALMGDGLFSYDYGADWHGNLWWYDEFGTPGGAPASTLPPRGYLGQPAGAPYLLIDTLSTPDQVRNGDFEDGLANWEWWVNTAAGAAASFAVAPSGGTGGSAAATVVVSQTAEIGDVEFRQEDFATLAGTTYSVSFWARSSTTMTLAVNVIKQSSPWTNYGFNVSAVVTPAWQHYHLSDAATVTAADGKLEFLLGDTLGQVWLDDVQLQEGALGVWARPFEHGLAVINTTPEVQSVPLPALYRKLAGRQAPLFAVRADDDTAQAAGAWAAPAATFDQFGATVHTIAGPAPAATMTYSTTLAYAGAYEVFAWVAPGAAQSPAVEITIAHAQGQAQVSLDQTQGSIGWHSLGSYLFDAGAAHLTLAAAGNGIVVADAFKWESAARYNDGTFVDHVTLQPRDGIVLHSASSVFSVFLPVARR